MAMYGSFYTAFNALNDEMKLRSYPIHPDKWQGLNVAHDPAAEMRELYFVDFKVQLPQPPSLHTLRAAIKPNLPWADEHFEKERVSGEPINPGETWKIWPWGNSADKFRDSGTEQFNHSYAERYWPRLAGFNEGGRLNNPLLEGLDGKRPNFGIRYPYGDLNDVVTLLEKHPLTRQAYLPVFFPEDTGAVHGGRIPCSLGYHFLQRGGALHIHYQLRSCDFFRHFRDDVYLTVRLLLWVLDQLRARDSDWENIRPGIFSMQIGSLHMFINDYRKLFG